MFAVFNRNINKKRSIKKEGKKEHAARGRRNGSRNTWLTEAATPVAQIIARRHSTRPNASESG